jgi:hypothetical protein
VPTLNTLDELGGDGDFEKSRHRANHGDAWDDLIVQHHDQQANGRHVGVHTLFSKGSSPEANLRVLLLWNAAIASATS